jgi:hypothetical protein
MAEIKITADTSQAERKINDLESALKDLNKVSGLVGGALAGITAAGVGLAVSFKAVTDQIGDLADLGKALGISAQQLGYLQQSAQLAGIGADELNAALFRLRGNIGDALVKGTGPAKDALDRLNISVRELSRLPADQQIAKITEQLLKIQNPAERAALAMDLLGKQGPRLLEVADNAARLAEEAKKMGIALSDVDIRNFQLAGDALDELSFIAKGALKTALAELAPYVIAIAQGLKESALEGGGIGNVIREKVIPAIKLAAQAMGILATFFVATKITAGVIAATAAMLKMYQAIKIATTAAGVLNAVLGKNPLLKIAGAVAGLIGAAVVVDQIGSAFDDLDKKAADIAAATQANLAKEAELRANLPPEVEKLNQEQEKALKALDETLIKLQQNTEYQGNILKFGKDEADIRKVIAEEAEKLKKVNLTMTPIQEQSLRLELEKEQGLKRQNELFNKQKSLVEGIISSQTDSTTKMFRDLENVRRAGRGEAPIAEVEINNSSDLKANAGRAEQIQLQNINKFIQNERAKYDDVFKLDLEYSRKVEEINKVAILARETGNADLIAQAEALQGTLLSLEQQYQDQRIALAESAAKKIEDRELKRIQTVLMANESGIAQSLSSEDSAMLQKIGQQERQKAIVAERIAFEKKSDLEKAQFGIDQAANMFAALGKENKKAFEASKALNIASAIMNTYQAATKALATYPFPFGLIAAAGAIAAGMAQVSVIRSQQYSGRALGGPVMGGTPYLVGESGPELFTPNTTGSITRNSDLGGSQPVNVNFTIVANDTQGFDQLLSSRKGVIQQIISDAMLERGQRSMM